MILNDRDIKNLERRYRANFMNALGGFKSVVLIGTKSVQDNENLAIFSSFFHLGADPALCGIIVRPNEEKQNTLRNIVHTKYYTINHIQPSFYKQAHQCSAKYEAGVNEFNILGLTPEYFEAFYAPFVQESEIKFGCELVQKIDITLNGTFLLIGKIIQIFVTDAYIKNDGFIDLEAAKTITCSGLDSYHTTQSIARLSYAQVDKDLHEI